VRAGHLSNATASTPSFGGLAAFEQRSAIGAAPRARRFAASFKAINHCGVEVLKVDRVGPSPYTES
jgi:hypothetical protein